MYIMIHTLERFVRILEQPINAILKFLYKNMREGLLTE